MSFLLELVPGIAGSSSAEVAFRVPFLLEVVAVDLLVSSMLSATSSHRSPRKSVLSAAADALRRRLSPGPAPASDSAARAPSGSEGRAPAAVKPLWA